MCILAIQSSVYMQYLKMCTKIGGWKNSQCERSPDTESSTDSRQSSTEALTPSDSSACWVFWAAAFSTVWMRRGRKSTAWLRVSPEQNEDTHTLFILTKHQQHKYKPMWNIPAVRLTFESPDHGLEIRLTHEGRGRLEAEGFFKPFPQLWGYVHRQTARPLR